MMKITIDNTVWSHVSQFDRQLLHPCLSYTYKKYHYNITTRKGAYKNAIKYLIDSNGMFLSGYIPRVKEYLDKKQLPYIIDDQSEKMEATKAPSLKGITLREDQVRLIKAVTDNQRGAIVAVTGSGKTLVAGGIMSCYEDKRFLFLVHTKSLLRQAINDFIDYGFTSIGVVNDQEKNIKNMITVALWQSFIKMDIDSMSEIFDGVLLDEVQHLSSDKVQYAEILQRLLAPIRIGLTATYPTAQDSQWAIEGMIGNIIGELTAEEAKEKGIVVDTKLIIRKTVLDTDVKELSRYADVYEQGVVKNMNFNRQVIKEAMYWVEQDESVLIFFTVIEHGKFLKKIADSMNFECELIYGATDSDGREVVKQNLKMKQLRCVIASKIWNEGISIPQLSVIINAAGGKSDIMIKQLHGRGTRLCEGKNRMIFIDFFNPSHNYLISHFGQRFSNYCDWGWV